MSLFHHSLSAWSGWRSSVQHVRMCWTNNGTPYSWKEPERSETESEILLNELIQDTANLLSESLVLKSLHLSIPRLDSLIPFGLKRLDSLTIPITDCLHSDPLFGRLLKLFQIPALKYVELDSMLRLNCIIPDDCRHPGTSSVTHLSFTHCGPINKEIAHVLSWPKNLQNLDFSIDVGDGLNNYAYDAGEIDHCSVPDALWPVETSLQSLSIDIKDYAGLWVGQSLQEKAFQSFTQLRRLSIPLGMLMETSDDYDYISHQTYEAAPPLHTRLPSSLQELVLQLNLGFWWGDWKTKEPSIGTKEILAYVSGLAEHKHLYVPNLNEVRISDGFHHRGIMPREVLPDFEEVWQLVTSFQSSGISLSFWRE